MPNLLLGLPETMSMCFDQRISFEALTPRYLAQSNALAVGHGSDMDFRLETSS